VFNNSASMFVTENRVAMGALTENYTSFAPAKYWNIQKKGEIKISFFDLRHRKWLFQSSTGEAVVVHQTPKSWNQSSYNIY
jgi:hypothetical protein